MKTVFDNRQLAHVWAQQTQATGRSNSMHFDGPTIYSYQTPIAKFYAVDPSVPGGAAGHGILNRRAVCLGTSETYSITTSGKHMPAVHRALSSSDVRTFSVPYVDVSPTGGGRQGYGTHQMNLDAIVARYVGVRARLSRTVNPSAVYDRLEPIQRDARAYAQVFGLDVPVLDAQGDSGAIDALLAARKAKRETPAYLAKRAREEAAKAEREAVAAAARVALTAEARGKWLSGAAHSWYGTDEKGGAYLRLSSDDTRVETSQGAHVPVSDAKYVINLIRGYLGREWIAANPQSDVKVGAFTVSHIAANGDIKAGCHVIQFSEIDRIGKLLGV